MFSSIHPVYFVFERSGETERLAKNHHDAQAVEKGQQKKVVSFLVT